jgi:hypothetical protein
VDLGKKKGDLTDIYRGIIIVEGKEFFVSQTLKRKYCGETMPGIMKRYL